MIGPLTIGRKAAKHGYKRYGVPGAVVAGVGGAAGYVVVKRKLTAALGSGSDTSDDEASDPEDSNEPDTTADSDSPDDSDAAAADDTGAQSSG